MSMMDSPLADRAEAAIRRLRDVDGVSVRAEDGEIVEIHVVSRSTRPAKLIVRDVQAVLRTDLDLSIDHPLVSVALARETRPAWPAERGSFAAASGEPPPTRPRPAPPETRRSSPA